LKKSSVRLQYPIFEYLKLLDGFLRFTQYNK
jgi:hypothetical protein